MKYFLTTLILLLSPCCVLIADLKPTISDPTNPLAQVTNIIAYILSEDENKDWLLDESQISEDCVSMRLKQKDEGKNYFGPTILNVFIYPVRDDDCSLDIRDIIEKESYSHYRRIYNNSNGGIIRTISENSIETLVEFEVYYASYYPPCVHRIVQRSVILDRNLISISYEQWDLDGYITIFDQDKSPWEHNRAYWLNRFCCIDFNQLTKK